MPEFKGDQPEEKLPVPTNAKDQPSCTRKRASRTAEAGRAFVRALRGDVAAWGQRWKLRLAAAWRGRKERSRQRRLSPTRPAGGTGTRYRAARMLGFLAVVALAGLLALAGTMLWAVHDLSFEEVAAEEPGRSVTLEAADGSPLGRIGELKSKYLALDGFADVLVDAVISVEDERFYEHFGIDPIGIARAARRNFTAGRIVEGGSTITQQLVKLRLLNNEQSFIRKFREAFAAIWLEMRLSKDEILARYLNTVYMGSGTYGVPAAARLYFNKDPAELELSEAALLAGLIRAPSRYNPLRDLDAARRRAEVVLHTMVGNGKISVAEADKAKQQPAKLDTPAVASRAGTWFADWVSREALDLTGSFEGSVRARTTLNPEYQKIAERVIKNALAENAERGISEAALVAMRPDGAVIAMVGGRDYEKSQFNRAAQAKRQPGSAFKLFVYMAALRSGASLSDTISGAPVEIKGWKPENFGGKQVGTVTLADAFAHSINTATVNLALKIGLENVIAAARDLGLDAPLEPLPSIALGSEEVSLLDLTAAYAGVLAGKAPVEPWGIMAVGTKEQRRLMSLTPPTELQRPLGPIRPQLLELLQLPVMRGTGRSAAMEGFTAGKTGTSQEYRDAWFVGFNESVVVGVWTGNDDGKPMEGVTGGAVPAAIWKAFMTETGIAKPAAPGLVADRRQPFDLSRGPGEGIPPSILREPPGSGNSAAPDITSGIPPITPPPDQDITVIRPPGNLETQPAPDDTTTALPDVPQGQQGNQNQAQCDIRACSSFYSSFDASDCTYQPFGGGPRQLCDKGNSPETAAPPNIVSSVPGQQSQQGSCNVAACSQTYSSFRATDCTYQPYGGGPRQVCDR